MCPAIALLAVKLGLFTLFSGIHGAFRRECQCAQGLYIYITSVNTFVCLECIFGVSGFENGLLLLFTAWTVLK